MRGKLDDNTFLPKEYRITPADAGKTGTVGVSAVGIEDHPRGCGENAVDVVHPRTRLGSPPRMRGKHL